MKSKLLAKVRKDIAIEHNNVGLTRVIIPSNGYVVNDWSLLKKSRNVMRTVILGRAEKYRKKIKRKK